VLPPAVFYQVMGVLLETTAAFFIEGLLKLKDISEGETKVLNTCLLKLVEFETVVFPPSSSESSSSTVSSKSGSRSGSGIGARVPVSVALYAPRWRKFCDLVVLLETPMVKMVEQFRAGRLRGFVASEIRHLVRAIFSDSPLRVQNLDKLRDPL
jgi:hypothetical protein